MATHLPPWLRFVQREPPSCNLVLIVDDDRVLIDSGFGGEVSNTARLLAEQCTEAADLALVVNTHHHSDHVGGNGWLQSEHGVPIAAHRWEAEPINRRDLDACNSAWLGQPVDAYSVDRILDEGDTITVGRFRFDVLHTPGHTLGSICLFQPTTRALIVGDLIQVDDVGWICPFREGIGALHRAITSVERLLALQPTLAIPGHGPLITDPTRVLSTALARYREWRLYPERAAWHACVRTLAARLARSSPIREGHVDDYLRTAPWVHDYATHVYGVTVEDFITVLLHKAFRAGVVEWRDGHLCASRAHPPPAEWLKKRAGTREWPMVPLI